MDRSQYDLVQNRHLQGTRHGHEIKFFKHEPIKIVTNITMNIAVAIYVLNLTCLYFVITAVSSRIRQRHEKQTKFL